MSTTELDAVEALLGRVLPDPEGFAERVLQQMMERLSPETSGDEPQDVPPSYDSTAQELLVDRNVLLAAAVGACECWGEDPDCRTCSGRGSAGWTEPDAHLYDEYIAPAVARFNGAAPAAPTEGESE